MTNRQERRQQRARMKPPVRGGPQKRNAGRRLLVLVAVFALIILALASLQFAGTPVVTPAPSL
ncbi:MAG TPA: hypothetical protein VF802_08640 [Candidatus Limnocylindrales bacterium]